MVFQPGDRVYHTAKHGYATVISQMNESTMLIEFDEPIGLSYRESREHRGWIAKNKFLELVSEAPDDTHIDISNLI